MLVDYPPLDRHQFALVGLGMLPGDQACLGGRHVVAGLRLIRDAWRQPSYQSGQLVHVGMSYEAAAHGEIVAGCGSVVAIAGY